MASLLSIRPGHAGDLDAMFALDCECFAEPFRFSRRTMAAFARAPNARTLVAEVAGRMAGFLIVELQEGGAYLVTLDVHPSHRRQGIASDLLGHGERLAAAVAASKLLLHVAEQNLPAIRFYEKAGYELVGQVANYYGKPLHALVYSKDIVANGSPAGESCLKIV